MSPARVEVAADRREASNPTFTLILCTVGRSEELTAALRSIAGQRGDRDYDLIIVDQNDSPDVVRRSLAAAGLDRGYLHLRCSKISLSYARNVGLQHRRGAVVGFPDDDCVYPDDLLARVRAHRRTTGPLAAGVCFRFSGDRIPATLRQVHASQSLGRIISFSFFLHADRLARELPGFDERLGVGAYFGACEETEFILRALPASSYLDVVHEAVVVHPVKDLVSVERARSYGRGFGALARIFLAKRSAGAPLIASKLLFGPLVRGAQALLSRRPEEARVHLAGLRGRLEGFFRWR